MFLFFALYGIVIGSFLNVLIYRIPKKEDFVKSRSHCMNCGYQLKWYDLVPVLSYVALRGKCRSCRTKISMQYPLIELLNGAAYWGIYALFGLSWLTVVYCLTASVLVVVFMIDLRHMIIPNGLVTSIFILGIAATILDGQWLNHIIGFFAVSVLLIIISIIVKGGMGFGDVKFMAAAGLLLGWQKIILALMLGSIVGAVIGVTLIALRIRERKEPIPFGPFLSIGVFIAMLYGREIIQWYLNVVLS